MYYKTVLIDPSRPERALTPAWVRQYSCAIFVISGLPDGFKSARVTVTKPAGDVVYADCSANETTGIVYAYFGPGDFPASGTGGKYEVSFVDADDRFFSAGEGTLQIMASTGQTGESAGKPYVPKIYWNGKWHDILAADDGMGGVTLAIDQTGKDLA